MTTYQKTRVLCIGHPYVLAINRAVERELALDPAFEVTVVAYRSYLELLEADLNDLKGSGW